MFNRSRSYLLTLVLFVSTATAQEKDTKPPSLPPTIQYVADVKYGEAPGKANLLDLYLPTAKDAKPRPLIVWVHGGGNYSGNKRPCPVARFVDAGFVVASINYRFIKEGLFPAQIQDCKGAIRWLRAHANEYGIDPTRIGVIGASAGGHHVSLLGTSGDIPELEGDVGGNLDQSSRVQAVVTLCGPTDMYKLREQIGPDNKYFGREEKSPIAALFGGIDKLTPEILAQANPITFITKDDAPFLILHGDQDNVVPYQQSQMLSEALKAGDIPVDLQIIKGGGHNLKPTEVIPQILKFFQEELIRKSNLNPALLSTTKPSQQG